MLNTWLPAMIALAVAVPALSAERHAFTPHDLVMLDRVSDPRISPDGTRVAYQVRQTDYAGNKGIMGVWLESATGASAPQRLTATAISSSKPRWSSDGKQLYFLSTRSGSTQVWKLDLAGGDAQPVTQAPLDINTFLLAPDGRHLVV